MYTITATEETSNTEKRFLKLQPLQSILFLSNSMVSLDKLRVCRLLQFLNHNIVCQKRLYLVISKEKVSNQRARQIMVTRKSFWLLSMKFCHTFCKFNNILLYLCRQLKTILKVLIYFLLQLRNTCQVHPKPYLPHQKNFDRKDVIWTNGLYIVNQSYDLISFKKFKYEE